MQAHVHVSTVTFIHQCVPLFFTCLEQNYSICFVSFLCYTDGIIQKIILQRFFYHLTQCCSANTLDIFQTGVVSILCQKWFTETSLHSTSTTAVLELSEQTALSLSHLEHAHTGCIHTHTVTHTCTPHTLCAWCVSITMLAVCMSTTHFAVGAVCEYH